MPVVMAFRINALPTAFEDVGGKVAEGVTQLFRSRDCER